MAVACAQPSIDNLLKGVSGAMGEVGVLDDCEARQYERKDDRTDTNRVDCGSLQSPAEKKHHRGSEGREERDQIDVVEEKHVVSRWSLVVSRWSLVVRYSSFAVRFSSQR